VRLLVCDDHRLFLEAVGHAFAAQGHEVVGLLTDPDDALRLSDELRPDVLVMDLGFPDHDGLESVRELRARVPSVRVLVLTASTDASTAWAALLAGAQGMVGKDQPVERILHALDQLAAGDEAFDLELLRRTPAPSPAAGTDPQVLRSLTPREREVLKRLVGAETTHDIARAMGITTSTARAYVQTVLMKLGVHSRVEAVSLVARLGIAAELEPAPD
jgi:two-component system, NarL family, nitrate/nitrite response regulator NarL